VASAEGDREKSGTWALHTLGDDETIAKLMGRDTSLRFKFIMEHAPTAKAEELDV
jgi:hypothetical protein